MHFGRISSSPENESSGRKCRLVPVYRYYSVLGVLPMVNSWGWVGGYYPHCPPSYAYGHDDAKQILYAPCTV